MLRIEKLDVSFGSVGILRNVDLSVPTGQFAGLIGRNGAGKTTLMRSIMGILPARNGAIHFDSQSLTSLPVHGRARLGIGYMPEDRRLVPELTVEENVLLPAWAIGKADAAQRLELVYTIIPEAKLFAQRKALQLRMAFGPMKLWKSPCIIRSGDYRSPKKPTEVLWIAKRFFIKVIHRG